MTVKISMRPMVTLVVLFAGLPSCSRPVAEPQTSAGDAARDHGDVQRDLPVGAPKKGKSCRGRDYLPLELGRVMHYQLTWSPPLGKPQAATAQGEMQAEVEIGDNRYFKQVTKISGIPFVPTAVAYYRSGPQGVYQILEGDEDKPEWIYLPDAIEIGDAWTASTSKGQLEFKALGYEEVETPSGQYRDCLKLSLTIKSTLGTVTEEQWLAPGVGVVKQTDHNALFTSTTLLDEVTSSDR